jgi:Cdc6-like AAA superfamily ATPase
LLGIESRIKGVSNTVNELRSHQQDQEYQAIIDWLTPVNYAPQQNDCITQWQEGTGEWLLKSNEFQQWLTQSNQTLFCPGMPGAGKTIITSIVVHYLYSIFGHDPAIGIAYLYCNFRQQDEQRPTDLILNLLKQFIQGQPSIPEIVQNLYSHHKPKQTRPSPGEFLSVLHHVTASYKKAFIIIDALDECQVSHGGCEIFLREILSLQAKAKMNIFVTSRFIEEVQAKFDKSIKLKIYANDTDVQKYLDNRLQNFPSSVVKDHSLQAEIKSKIAKAVDGMYVLYSILRELTKLANLK